MLVPKRVKFRKWQRAGDTNPGPASRGTTLAFGSFGLKALSAKWVNSRQIEAARKALTRYIQRGGKVWIRIFPDKPITRKPPEVTMGGGKGDPVGYVFPVRPGHILFEIDGVSEAIAKEALLRAGAKLPVKVRVVKRENK